MLYRKWKIKQSSRTGVRSLQNRLGIPKLAARVLCSKGITEPEKAKKVFLEDTPLSDPYLMLDMDKAVERITRAIENEEKIVVYGDYDVDGVCSAAVLFSHLENLGANVFYKLPNRETEGYGMNKAVIKRLADLGVGLIITVDNGIAALEEVDLANELGIDVVVTDHHLPKETLPKAYAVVDPLRPGDESPCKMLAGVGVAFKLVCALDGGSCEEMLDFYADLVAVGTIADLMLLQDENRTIVKAGLEMLNDSPSCGFEHLIAHAGLAGKRITAENVSFGIAPRINAAGRMGDASKALELLLSDSDREAEELASFLEKENAKRQEVQNKIAEDITREILKDKSIVDDKVIVVRGEDYHPGVIGIVASRLVETYGKPAIVCTKDGDDYKGSGRSVPGFNLNSALVYSSKYLEKFGGHELAAGLTLQKDNIENFRRAINEFAQNYPDLRFSPELEIDCLVNFADIDLQSVYRLDMLAPYGNGNPRPVFAAEGLLVTGVFPVSDGKHVRVKMSQNGREFAGIFFNTTPGQFAYKPGDYIDACFSLSVFEGTNGGMISIRLKEVRPRGMSDKVIDAYNLYSRFRYNFELSKEERARLFPTREQVAAVYRKIAAGKTNSRDLRPLFMAVPPAESGKIRIIIDVLTDLGLIETKSGPYGDCFAPVAVQGKKDLMSSKILIALQG